MAAATLAYNFVFFGLGTEIDRMGSKSTKTLTKNIGGKNHVTNDQT
jgi:hypothetical protein